MILKILPANDPILRQKSKPVKKIDKKIKKLISDMKHTLSSQKDPEGVGLAAPQVGKKIQLFLAKVGNAKIKTIINPKVVSISKTKGTKKGKKKKAVLEGCLSVPHFYGPLARADKVTVKYQDEKGKEKKETFTSFDSQIVLHEIDHLKGVLFIDRLLEQKRPLYEQKDDEWVEVDLP